MRSSRNNVLFRELAVMAVAAFLLAGCNESSPTEPKVLAATPGPTPTPLPPGGNLAGAWTGTYNPANVTVCGSSGVPAQAIFTQDGSTVRGTVSTASVPCGTGTLTFGGALHGNALAGVFDDDEGLEFPGTGTLSGASVEIAIGNGGSFVLHR